MIDRSFWRRVAASWIRIHDNDRIDEAVESMDLKEYVVDLHDELDGADDELD